MKVWWLSVCLSLATTSVAFMLRRPLSSPRWLGRPSPRESAGDPLGTRTYLGTTRTKNIYARALPGRTRAVPLPQRPDLHRGLLSNGLEYLVLSTPSKDDRDYTEAHLEILSGSADEMEHQQGMGSRAAY